MAQRIIDQTISIEDLEKDEKEFKEKDKKIAKAAEAASDSSVKKASKQKKLRGKNYKDAKNKINAEDIDSILDAVKVLKKASYTKFKESVEAHVNLSIDPQDSSQRIRFATSLPHGIGKAIKVLVISSDNSGKKKNVLYRDETVVNEIIKGKLTVNKDFDVVVATPEKIKELAKAAKILGPKGMMPSPKTGTVTDEIEEAVKNLSQGQVEIKSQQGHSVIHQMVGKLDMKEEQIAENVSVLIAEINKNKPAKTKGKLIKKITLSTTMGPSVRINL